MEDVLLNEIELIVRALHLAGYARHNKGLWIPMGEDVGFQCWSLNWYRRDCSDDSETLARLNDLPDKGHVLQFFSRDAQHTLELGYAMSGQRLKQSRVISSGRGDEDGALFWWLNWAINVRKNYQDARA